MQNEKFVLEPPRRTGSIVKDMLKQLNISGFYNAKGEDAV